MITKAIAGSYFFTKMAEDTPAAHDNYDTCEEAIVAARNEIAEATRLTFHIKTLVVVSDDHHRILWAAASDGFCDHPFTASPTRRAASIATKVPAH